MYCDYVEAHDNLDNLYNITAFGGHGQYDSRQASAGTVYVRYSDQEYGDLYIDDNVVDGVGNPSGTAAVSTELPHIGFGAIGELLDGDGDGLSDTLTTNGLVPLLAGGLTGIRINPNSSQDETFVIVSNTANAITVATPNENGVALANVAAAGDTYSGSYLFDNVAFRRGGNLKVGDSGCRNRHHDHCRVWAADPF